MAYNAKFCMEIIKQKSSDISQYSYTSIMDAYDRVINNLEKYDNTLYRIEKQYKMTENEALTIGYNGVSYSSSTYYKELHSALEKLGLEKFHVQIKYNMETTKMVDMILGIKYIIGSPVQELKKDYDVEYEEKFIEKNVKIYKNPYNLSIGYAVNKEIFETNMNESDTFNLQNQILKNMTGIDEAVYAKHKGEIIRSIQGLTENGKTYNLKGDESAKIKYEFEVESTDNLYIYVSYITDDGTKIFVNGEEKSTSINLGKRQIGEKIEIEIIPTSDTYLNGVYVYYENDEILKKYYQELSEEQVSLKKINDSNYEGSVNITGDNEYILFTIPYDNGWKIKIDNEEVGYERVLNSLIAVKTEKGEHEISLEYMPPKFEVGMVVSCIGIGVFIVYIILSKRHIKGQKIVENNDKS